MTQDLRTHEHPDSDLRLSGESLDSIPPGSEPSARPHAIAAVRRSSERLPIWARAVVAVAVIHIGASLILYFSAPLPVAPQSARDPAVLPPWWLYAALASTFLALGLGLVLANRRDARAAWFGGVLILAGAPFASLLLEASSRATWLLNVRPEAFSGAFFWSFLARFPTEFTSRTARTLVRVMVAAAAIAGLWCAIATLALLWVPADGGWRWLMAFALAPRTLYWPTVLGFVAPTFPVLLWRAALAEGSARDQIKLFVTGLLIGFGPFIVEVLIEEMVPAYRAWAYGPSIAPWIGTLIFAALAVVPFLTAYSVLFDRVVDVRVVLRAAAQYILARYTIVGVTLVPFAALALYLVEHRAEPIVSLVTGSRPLALGSVITLGLVSFRLRSRWLNVLDHRYFRESYEAHDVLGRIVALPGTSTEQLADGISQELQRTFHAETHVFLPDETRTALQHAGERLPPIAVGSKLLDLVLADPRPMDIDVDDPQSLLSRLPDKEQQWLRSSRASLLISLRSSRGGLEGVLALTMKGSGLPFSDGDRRLLAAVSSVASMAFESLRLRSSPPTPIEQPARECLQCRRLAAFETERCECGGDLALANVPHILRGNFRFKRRIGAGGMGVVYRAVDLALNRDVAMKALPRVTPELITRLKREARAMAAVTHPNLAVIHGVETWQGMPFLVEEYLGGGTLAQRLAAGRLDVREAIDLGLTLTGVLQHMHTSGVIHCDIKPSNIGYTQHGIVKILDFGLARVTRDLNPASVATASGAAAKPADAIIDTGGGGWFGTPPYMSPEAAAGEPATPSFDLWALAVVLYESMAGSRPFRGQDAWETLERIRTSPAPDIRVAWPEAPALVAALFHTLLAPDRAQRPHDASAFGSALRRLRESIG